MNYRHEIHFTPEEAASALDEVVILVEAIRDAKQALDESGYDIRGHHFFAGMGSNGTRRYPKNVDRLITHFRDLTARGILVKDMDRGLIDFPAIRSNGEEVYLCYHLGEQEIAWWHRIEDGYPGRTPLSDF